MTTGQDLRGRRGKQGRRPWQVGFLLSVRLWCGLCSYLLPGVRVAEAHDPFETTTVVTVQPTEVEVTTTMARQTAKELFGAELAHTLSRDWARTGEQLYAVRSGERALPLLSATVREGTRGEAKGDLVFRLVFAAARGAGLQVQALYLQRMIGGYTGAIQVSRAEPPALLGIKVLHADDATIDVALPSVSNLGQAAAGAEESLVAGVVRRFGDFAKVGVQHVLVGYDHLLFLLGVLLGCERLRHAVGVLTTFTIAHSVTLSLAALHFLPLANSVVEPLIALSIAVAAYVGSDLNRRELLLPVTFAFGLIHGLGFASGLETLGDAGNVQLLSLLAFNLGVEAGQLAVAVILLPILIWCRQSQRGSAVLEWAPPGIAAMGLGLFAWRMVDLV